MPEEVSIIFPDTVLPDGTAAPNPAVKMFVFPNKDRGGAKKAHRQRLSTTSQSSSSSQQPGQPGQQQSPASSSSDDDNPETATTPIQAWSPVPTERSSTPPYESASTAAGLARNRHSRPHPAAVHTPGDGGDGSSSSDAGSRGREARGRSSLSWVASLLGVRRTRSVQIAPRPLDEALTPLPSTPHATAAAAAAAAAAEVSPSSEQHDSEAGPPRAPFGGPRDLFPSTPSVFGASAFGDDGDNGDEGGDEAAVSGPSSRAAARRAAAEADVEEGGLPATGVSAHGAGARAREADSASESVAVARALTYDVAEPAVIENGIVMPCPPSEQEKVRQACLFREHGFGGNRGGYHSYRRATSVLNSRLFVW